MKIKQLAQQYGVQAGLILLSIVLLILPYLPEPTGGEPGFSVFLGRFHPLLVHFPIVLIIIPLLLEGLRRIKNWQFVAHLMPIFITLAVASAFASAIAGYLLYGSGEYSGELVQNHLWAGILLALSVNVCALVWYWKWENVLFGLLILSNLLLLYTGHLGGSLTHGSTYLTELLPSFGETKAPIEQKPLAELNVFDDIIMAVFDAKCLTCHNEQKAKGKLIMTSFEGLEKGGDSGDKMVVGGDLEGSALYHRIALPLDHDDHMPPSGKSQLSEEEKQLIAWWIASGGSADQVVGELTPADTIYGAFNSYLPQIANRQRIQIETREERDKIAKKLVPLAEELGFEITPDPEADSLLFAISMQLPAAHITDASLVELLPYGHAISKISLVSAEITDDGLYTLSLMPELRHLYLSKTCIDGSGLSYLAALSKLETLNLSETFVDDVHILNLLNMPQLKNVYLYRSEVSLNVIAALQDYMPGTEVSHALGDLF